jgi:hypothetical protein
MAVEDATASVAHRSPEALPDAVIVAAAHGHDFHDFHDVHAFAAGQGERLEPA